MKISTSGLISLKMANQLFACILIAFTCPVALAESIKISDQFGNPIENVVISFTTSEATKSENPDIVIMDQIDKQFAPRVLVVQKNQTVSFPNSDDIRHHLYSFSKPKPFEFKMFKGGESKQLTFDQTGIVVLGCNIHDQMVGYIYVAENEHTVMTNDQGIAELPSAGLAVKLWHSRLSANKIERKDVQLAVSDSEQPFPIILTLLADVKTSVKSKFGSNKFSKGNP
jgi:plastocyanin